jgi:peptide deformylase
MDGRFSSPGFCGETIRPHYLRVTGLDERERPFDRVFEGFDAVVVHHEMDHTAALKLTIPQNVPLIDLPDVERLLSGCDWRVSR